MTQVDFHTHVGDKISYTCRLVRKAYALSQRLVVVAEPVLLRAVDERLWVFSALEFIPHCMLSNALAAVTPVVLATHFDDAPHYQILLNLSAAMPPHFARFERLLEVVSGEAEDLTAARTRYRFYRDRGYALNSYQQSDWK